MARQNAWEKQADDNNDKQWLDWLKEANRRAEELESERNFIDIARKAELEFRLSHGTCSSSDEIYIKDIMMDESLPVIYAYSDDQAVEDGLLVPIANLNLSVMNRVVDRVTISVWAEIVRDIPKDSFGSISQPALEAAVLELLTPLGGAPPILINKEKGVWCVMNERSRWTLMHPSDY